MLRRTVLAILLLSAILVISPLVICKEEPYVIDDFEGGVGKWFEANWGGAPNAMFEETKDAHDGKRAMKITVPKGKVGGTLVETVSEGAKYVKLVDEGYEAFNFWIKGIEGIDEQPPALRLQLLGIGDHTKDNRWLYNFAAPLDEWTFFSIPFKDFEPWQEKREFKIEFLDYLGFDEPRRPWPDMEFIVDQIEVGYITEIEAKSVEPLEKLSVTWGRIKGY